MINANGSDNSDDSDDGDRMEIGDTCSTTMEIIAYEGRHVRIVGLIFRQ